MNNQTRPTGDAHAAADQERRIDGSDGRVTAAERRELERSLGSMDTRLDQLLRSMTTATGADRTEAMATVIQELAAQVAQMRGLLLDRDLRFDGGGAVVDGVAGADGQAVFITPGSAAQAEERRRGELADDLTASSSRTTRSLGAPAAGTSSLSSQAESRRRGVLGADPADDGSAGHAAAAPSDGSTATSSLSSQAETRRSGEEPPAEPDGE